MKCFELSNNQPRVTTEAILTFDELFKRDTSEKKERFFAEMEFVYFSTDYRSYYLSYQPEERQAKIIEDYIKIPGWKPDVVVERAIQKYKELQKTQSLGLLEDARYALEKIRGYYRGIDFKQRDVKGGSVYKIKEVTGSIGDISKMIESIDKLEHKVQKEEQLNSKTRGGGRGSFFEDRK
jgi:hypothetical protein